MLTFMIRRILLAMITIWALSMISFVVIQLPPGDFVDQYILELLAGGGLLGRVHVDYGHGRHRMPAHNSNRTSLIPNSTSFVWR